MKKIPLTKGKFAIVDDEDYHYLIRFKWQYAVDKYGNESARRSFDHKFGKSHVNLEDYIVPRPHGGAYSFVFINGNKLDCRKENISFTGVFGITQRARKMPLYKGKPTLSKYKGVSKNNRKNPDGSIRGRYLWRVQIESGKRGTPEYKRFVKLVETEDEAGLLYNKKAREWFGENAFQNKI